MKNYFELFNLPATFSPNLVTLKKQYHQLSRACHPDFHSQSTEQEQESMLEQSSLLNQAYQTLTHPDQTMAYLLGIKQILLPNEKHQLSPAFLMEMMDLNDAVMAADSMEAKNTLKHTIQAIQKKIYEPISAILEDPTKLDYSEKELLQVKEFYYQKKYLNRILEGLTT